MKTIFKILCLFCVLSTTIANGMYGRDVIRLGETPWKFSKVIMTKENVMSNSQFIQPQGELSALADGNVNTEWGFPVGSESTFIIHTNGDKNITTLVCKFRNTDIEKAFFKIEISNKPDGDWVEVVDYYRKGQNVFYQETETIAEIENTVGHIRQKDFAYITEELKKPLSGLDVTYDYIKLSVNKVQDKDGNNLLLKISEIELLAEENLSDLTPEHVTQFEYDDNAWEVVGIPHCFNDMDTYLNVSDMMMWKGETWYRKELFIDKKYKDKRIFLEFEGVNIGTAVYINGKFKEGNTKVEQPGEVTHVGGFIPFVVDITDDVEYGKKNLLAVRVSNASNSFYTCPGFGNFTPFGMGWGGIVAPVNMVIADKVYIPLDDYSVSGKWGTYNATISADENKAKLRFQTCVENTNQEDKSITLQTILLDATGKKVNEVNANSVIKANGSFLYDQSISVVNPELWYPNSSLYGKPYLYTVVRNVIHKGKVIDSNHSRLGIRMVSWDADYCYINGKKHLLNGFGHRNIYPALGSAVPAELQWKDIYLLATCGANTLRIGHVPPTREMLDACDEYGIMVLLNSGDNEWTLKDEPARSYKAEYDRNAIIAFRNHTSVIIWESNNGIARNGNKYMPQETQVFVNQWDSLQLRAVLNRDGGVAKWDKSKPLIVGYTNFYRKVKGCPTLNTEVYGANWEGRASWNAARFDYDNEKKLSNWYVGNYIEDLQNKACGWIDWMLTETQGEGYTIYLNGKRNQKSLGSCAMDANRFPKLKYHIYEKALWVPFEIKPGVALQSHWNLSGIQDVDAWSNCPQVEMSVNGKSYGVRKPDPDTKHCKWDNIVWTAGEVKVKGLDKDNKVVCEETIRTTGEPYAIELTVEEPLTSLSGRTFTRRANGSDAIIITARIIDKDGLWCPLYDENITFDVEGEGVYKGSADFYITDGKGINYHAPGDKELQVEGGLVRVAVRSTFKPGKVNVKAVSGNLPVATVSFSTSPVLGNK